MANCTKNAKEKMAKLVILTNSLRDPGHEATKDPTPKNGVLVLHNHHTCHTAQGGIEVCGGGAFLAVELATCEGFIHNIDKIIGEYGLG